MIKLQIIGHLGKDCMVKEINGRSVINFSVAHTDKYKGNTGVMMEKTTWVECAYWTDKLAVAPYLKKGQQVYVEGHPEADAYMGKDGKPAGVQRLRVQSLQLLGGKGEAPPPNSTTQTEPLPSTIPGAVDDLPF